VARSELREGRGDMGCDAGLTMARRRAASDARAGGAERATASLPPLESRRVWLGDSSGRGGCSASSAPRPRGPAREGRDGRPSPPRPSAPAPASTRDPLQRLPLARRLSTAPAHVPSQSARSPEAL
jgi:hypothetical protein